MSGVRSVSRLKCLAFLSLLATNAPGHGAELAQQISAAQSAAALEAILTANPSAKGDVLARASAVGLPVISFATGLKEQQSEAVRIAGGGKPFRDCDGACPAMLVVPSSPKGFKIGTPESERDHMDDERQIEVSVEQFAIAAMEATVAEYKACVADGGCNPPEWLEAGGRHNIETGSSRYYRNLGDNLTEPGQPVVGVSFEDATAYAAWLYAKTGHAYRLPSEAEWEYAARAGTTTAFWWGDQLPDDGAVHAACKGCGGEWDGTAPAPANAFAPNPWGLFNVHGNVWEWTADYYCEDYSSGPRNGAPRSVDDCASVDEQPPSRGVRSMRGGSVFYSAKVMRSGMRARNVPDFRNFSVGFRVARDLKKTNQ
jgi:formylglycine-generating enzyme required for sulfatase activity